MAQEATIVDGKQINEPSVKTRVHHSTFPLGAPVLGTYRYGEYGVIFADENIGGDGFTWRLPHEIRSFMLKGPLMQGMKLCKDMFWVPKQAIIPNAWERLNTIAQFGDQAPEDADTVIYGFNNLVRSQFITWMEEINNGIRDKELVNLSGADTGLANQILHFIIMAEMFYSRGSLLSACGYPMAAFFFNQRETKKTNYRNFGKWYDDTIEKIKSCCDNIKISWDGGYQYTIKWTEEECISRDQMSIRTALCKMRDDLNFTATINLLADKKTWPTVFLKNSWEMGIQEDTSEEDKPFNYERLVAYQMVCSHYYSNDHIDYIYTAELYRQLMGNYVYRLNNGGGIWDATWEYNGIKIRYDYLSGKVLKTFIEAGWEELPANVFAYIRSIFQFNRSLRFKDYFTGSRSVPLSVGEYNIPVDVNNELVNVIDVTKGILWQKLGNAMQKTGARIEKQIKQLQGVDMKPDYHNPFWLGHTEDGIGAPESEGTAEALFFDEARNGNKLPVAAQFRSNAGRMQFSTKLDREGIVLAIQYFEIPRLYVNSVERFFYHANQFDKFNTYLQYMGDQEVKTCELDITRPYDNNFGYQGRYMEYKQKVGRAWGGFVYDLPGWCFIADNTRTNVNIDNIGPSYIRSLQTEIDELFQTLYGYSYDTYYHFICKTSLSNVARRPMAARPGILTK